MWVIFDPSWSFDYCDVCPEHVWCIATTLWISWQIDSCKVTPLKGILFGHVKVPIARWKGRASWIAGESFFGSSHTSTPRLQWSWMICNWQGYLNVVNMINADTRIELLRSGLLKQNVKKDLRCHDVLVIIGWWNELSHQQLFCWNPMVPIISYPYCTFFGFAVHLMS